MATDGTPLSFDVRNNRTILGGVTMHNRWSHQQCAVGDFILLTDRDTIEFATPEEFAGSKRSRLISCSVQPEARKPGPMAANVSICLWA
jgi:hypothetical protein